MRRVADTKTVFRSRVSFGFAGDGKDGVCPAGQTVVLRGLVPLSVKGWEGIPYSVLPGTAGMHALPETGRHAAGSGGPFFMASSLYGIERVVVFSERSGYPRSRVLCGAGMVSGTVSCQIPVIGSLKNAVFFIPGQPWRIHGGRLRGWPLFSPFRISFRQDGFIRFARGRTGGGFGDVCPFGSRREVI